MSEPLQAAYALLFIAALVVLAIIFAAALWRIRHNITLAIGLPLLVFLVYSNASDLLTRIAGIPSLLQPMIGILAIAVWYFRKRLQPAEPVFTLLTLLLALYALLVFASTTWAKDLSVADQRVSDVVKGFAIYLLIAMLAASWTSLRQGMAALLVAASFLGCLSLFQVVTGNYGNEFGGFATVQSGTIYSDVAGLRIAGPLHDPNFYAQMLLVALPLAIVIAIAARTMRARVVSIAAAILICAITILTYSRGAMLALAAMTVMLLASLRVRLMHAAAIVVAVVVIFAALPSTITSRLITVEQLVPGAASGVEQDASVEKRKLVLATAWNMFLDHPFLGVGAANFGARFGRYSLMAGASSRQYDEPGVEQFPHSLYAQIAAETGLIALLLFAAAMAAAFASLYRSRRELIARGRSDLAAIAVGVAVAVAGFLLTSTFLHGAWQRSLWILLGFTAAIARLRSVPDAEVTA
jgi:putative inorganic carbon (HCO3(-)) transporter